jgi:hypothetical protein
LHPKSEPVIDYRASNVAKSLPKSIENQGDYKNYYKNYSGKSLDPPRTPIDPNTSAYDDKNIPSNDKYIKDPYSKPYNPYQKPYDNPEYDIYYEKPYNNPQYDNKIPSQALPKDPQPGNYSESPYPKYDEKKYYQDSPYNRYPDNPYKKTPDSLSKYQEIKNTDFQNPESNYSQNKSPNPAAKYPNLIETNDDPKFTQNENELENKYEDPMYPEYTDEIEKLKEELRKKEEELTQYQNNLIQKPPNARDPDDQAIYSRINKSLFDKQRLEEQKKINSASLEYQISQKSKVKSFEQMEKEKEQAIRLEMLKKLKEDEARERYEKFMKAKEYREQLEVQSLVKSNINNQEKLLYKNDIPKNNEANLGMIDDSNSISNPITYTPGSQKFTKKTPKTICYNPITGVLRDTSQYVLGQYPPYNIKDPSITYLKNQSQIPELSAHPAFQSQKFTKNHPKVVPSYPVTGNIAPTPNQDWKDEDPKNTEKHMAEYGSLMMQGRNPTYN